MNDSVVFKIQKQNIKIQFNFQLKTKFIYLGAVSLNDSVLITKNIRQFRSNISSML